MHAGIICPIGVPRAAKYYRASIFFSADNEGKNIPLWRVKTMCSLNSNLFYSPRRLLQRNVP